jgi:hypothetical protein
MADDRLMTTLADALTEVGPHLTRSRLQEVSDGLDEEKAGLLTRFIYGSITWSTELGRPDAPTLTAGIRITHEARSIHAVGGQDGVRISDEFVEVNDVSSWDEESSGDKHRIGFLAQFHPLHPNRFSVDLVRMPWRDGRGPYEGVRTLRPQSVLLVRPSRIAFLEFEILLIPHLDIERAGILVER